MGGRLPRVDVSQLRFFTALPRSRPPSQEQLLALQVLSDEWIDQDRPVGLLLAERLQHVVPEARAVDLGLDPGLASCDVRTLALRASELATLTHAIARGDDFDFAVRVLSWVLSAPEGRPLHALVAQRLEDMLMQVERRELDVVRQEHDLFTLQNGWVLDVFVRHHDFGRIDAMTSPDGFEVFLIDYATGPLSAVRDYRPPTDVAREVFGLGFHARRRWAG